MTKTNLNTPFAAWVRLEPGPPGPDGRRDMVEGVFDDCGGIVWIGNNGRKHNNNATAMIVDDESSPSFPVQQRCTVVKATALQLSAFMGSLRKCTIPTKIRSLSLSLIYRFVSFH